MLDGDNGTPLLIGLEAEQFEKALGAQMDAGTDPPGARLRCT